MVDGERAIERLDGGWLRVLEGEGAKTRAEIGNRGYRLRRTAAADDGRGRAREAFSRPSRR